MGAPLGMIYWVYTAHCCCIKTPEMVANGIETFMWTHSYEGSKIHAGISLVLCVCVIHKNPFLLLK